MEHNPNNSRIGIELGNAPSEGTEKAHLRATVNFGRNAADLQSEKLKSIIGAEDPNLALVIVLRPNPGKHKELEDLLNGILDGSEGESEVGATFARNVASPFKDGLAEYKVINSGSNIVLHIKPGPAVAEIVSQQVEMILSLGLKDLAATEQAAINLNLVSGIDFNDLLDFHNKGYTTMAAFWTSFMIELTVKSLAGSQLSDKLVDLLKAFVPFIAGTPLPLLPLLQKVDVDFSFNSAEELPASLKREFNDDPEFAQLPRVIKEDKDTRDFKLFGRITDLLHAHVEVYATLEKVAAVHVDIRAPGFGVALTTPQLDSLQG